MFFLLELHHKVILEPAFCGPRLRDHITAKLYSEVEGKCSGKYGYIITIVNVLNYGTGRILPGRGMVEFDVEYHAIVFKPFKNEVLDATVGRVNKIGFFAEVGPLEIFVSNYLMPPSMKFNPDAATPCYQSDTQVIERGSHVRVKIVGIHFDATEIIASGTIREDYLGLASE
ncbi:hypothetical protein GQ42DRAFT_27053 [Ramicandelaber brevisporus]|nr:hypothetical protein GQ42DRAFT_27053 [Ramicandelaber brevisporus]